MTSNSLIFYFGKIIGLSRRYQLKKKVGYRKVGESSIWKMMTWKLMTPVAGGKDD